jgi:hypothetical protein
MGLMNMYWPGSLNYSFLICVCSFKFITQKNKKNNELCNRASIILQFFNVIGFWNEIIT